MFPPSTKEELKTLTRFQSWYLLAMSGTPKRWFSVLQCFKISYQFNSLELVCFDQILVWGLEWMDSWNFIPLKNTGVEVEATIPITWSNFVCLGVDSTHKTIFYALAIKNYVSIFKKNDNFMNLHEHVMKFWGSKYEIYPKQFFHSCTALVHYGLPISTYFDSWLRMHNWKWMPP